MSSVGTVTSYDALGFDPAPGDLAPLAAVAQRCRHVALELGEPLTSLSAIAAETILTTRLEACAQALGLTADALSRWEAELGEMKHQARLLELEARRAQDEGHPIVLAPADNLRTRHERLTRDVTAELDRARELLRG